MSSKTCPVCNDIPRDESRDSVLCKNHQRIFNSGYAYFVEVSNILDPEFGDDFPKNVSRTGNVNCFPQGNANLAKMIGPYGMKSFVSPELMAKIVEMIIVH